MDPQPRDTRDGEAPELTGSEAAVPAACPPSGTGPHTEQLLSARRASIQRRGQPVLEILMLEQ